MVRDYIMQSLPKTVCVQTEDNGDLIGLPRPYTVPTEGDMFHCMYYWDTYFTNLGLLRLGMLDMAKNNVDNMLFLVQRFGFMPNANRERYLSRSQPPFLTLMVQDIFAQTNDTEWLLGAYRILCREHDFWMHERMTPTGLNRYGREIESEHITEYAARYYRRTRLFDIDESAAAASYLTHAESGWDCNPRWGDKGETHICAPDLNSLLWACEDRLSAFAAIVSPAEAPHWRTLADMRRQAMRELLIDPKTGLYADRDYIHGIFFDAVSVASFYPLFVGMATEEEAAAALCALPLLEREYGIVPCHAPAVKGNYQWNAPNAWPCLQVVVAAALARYGYKEDAARVAKKYIFMVDRVFAKTGGLWEKYNADTGTCETVNEYQTPNMLGWTAGAYIWLQDMFA